VARTFDSIVDQATVLGGFGSADQTRIIQCANLAVRDLYSTRRWRWREDATQSISTVAGNRFTAFAYGTFADLRFLMPTSVTGNSNLEWVDPDADDERFTTYVDPTTKGPPEAFTLRDEQIMWYPYPDAVYNFTVVYFAGAPAEFTYGAGASLAPIPDDFIDYCVFRTCELAYMRARDWISANEMSVQATAAIRGLSKGDRDISRQGIRRSRLPRTYGAIYNQENNRGRI
jgi:hypothetical protein